MNLVFVLADEDLVFVYHIDGAGSFKFIARSDSPLYETEFSRDEINQFVSNQISYVIDEKGE